MMRTWRTVIALLALALIIAGLVIIYWPAALVVTGGLLWLDTSLGNWK